MSSGEGSSSCGFSYCVLETIHKSVGLGGGVSLKLELNNLDMGFQEVGVI